MRKFLAVVILNLVVIGASGFFLTGRNYILTGTTGSIGGGALLAGACTTGTATVTGAKTGMQVQVAPSDGTNIPALTGGVVINAIVTANDTVTVDICAITALTPTSKTYNVSVLQSSN